MDMPRCTLSGSAGLVLHALLVLYASLLLRLATASTVGSSPNTQVDDFRLVQIEVTSDEPYPSWDVEGVATILTGGTGGSRTYLFDCYKPGSSQLIWTRDDEGPISTLPIPDRARFGIASEDASGSLGLYKCVDTDDDSSVVLNITDENPALNAEESSMEAFVGDLVTLTVYVSSLDGRLNLLEWTAPNGTELSELFYPGTIGFPATTTQLSFSNVTLADSGVYNLSAFRSSSGVEYRAHTPITLSVFVPPTITSPPVSNITVDERQDVKLVCVATGSSSSLHHLSVTWLRVGENDNLPVSSTINVDSDEGEGAVTVTSTLNLVSIRYADLGTYRCQAQVSLTETSCTDTADTVVSVTPTIAIEHGDLNGNLLQASTGTSLAIDCYGSGNLTWTTTREFNITSDSNLPIYTLRDPSRGVLQLHIPNFNSFDLTAVYTCSSDLLPGLTHSILITNGEADVAVFVSASEIFARKGDTVQISASIHSLSDVTSILWYRNEMQLEPDSDGNYTAQSDESSATLTILDLREEHVGQYRVEVRTAGSTADATASVQFAEPTTASVSPSQLNIAVGGMVEVSCAASGSGSLDIVWSLRDGSTALPDGVVADRDKLTIAIATLNHSNLYICTVSNTFYSSQGTFNLTVVDPLVVEIEYENVINTSHVLFFRHGDVNPPSFKCIHHGSPDTSITWQVSGGAALPRGTVIEDGHTLTWTHRLEYTDSGVYECRAVDPITRREGVATVDMTVIHEPVLDTIFPAPGVTTGNTAIDFLIPIGVTGTVLTCIAFAWPPPIVEWSKNSGALPQGMTTRTRMEGGGVISELIFLTQFTATSVGMYKCEVHSSVGDEEEVVVHVSQLVELHQGTTETTEHKCPEVSDNSVLFQLRVSTTSCDSWSSTMLSEIAEDFQNLLTRVISIQCGTECDVSKTTLMIGTLKCSELIDGGVVFRGPVNTTSSSQTEKIFCALSRWQSAGSLVTIDGNRFAVDSQCSLRIDSYEAAECAEEPTEASVDIKMVLVIAIPAGGIGLLSLVVIVISVCSLCYCRCCKKKKVSDGSSPANLVSFSRTQSDCQPPLPPNLATSRHSVTSMDRQQDNPSYADGDRYQPPQQLASPLYDVAVSSDRQPLCAVNSLPPNSTPGRERETTFTDSGVSLNMTSAAPPGSASPPHEPRGANTSVQPYQIPTASSGSINKMGAVNPLWGVEDNSSRRGRRHSEGPPNRTPPSCFRGGTCVETGGSMEDYSRLTYSMPPAGGSRGAAPERRWYIGSEESYTSLQQTRRNHPIAPYASVHSSQISTSPLNSPPKKSFPELPPPQLPSRERARDSATPPAQKFWTKSATPPSDHDTASVYRKPPMSPSAPAIHQFDIIV